jgi:hypothetical protein
VGLGVTACRRVLTLAVFLGDVGLIGFDYKAVATKGDSEPGTGAIASRIRWVMNQAVLQVTPSIRASCWEDSAIFQQRCR